jgi:hypothetical protein
VASPAAPSATPTAWVPSPALTTALARLLLQLARSGHSAAGRRPADGPVTQPGGKRKAVRR